MAASQVVMLIITIVAAVIACLPLPSLFGIALIAFQIMVQLSVPLYFGIFMRIGDWRAALAAMIVGIGTAAVLQGLWLLAIPWALGLTWGAVALLPNLAMSALERRTSSEHRRLDALFAIPQPGAQ